MLEDCCVRNGYCMHGTNDIENVIKGTDNVI